VVNHKKDGDGHKNEQVVNMEGGRRKSKYKGSRQMYKLSHFVLPDKTQ
jgi:hypothetical protein